MERSWRTGKVESTPTADTIADGIAVRVPVREAVADMQGIIDDVVLVSDQAILAAMRLILDRTGILVEPSGAVGIAALQTHRSRFAGGRSATVLCGGNITMEQFKAWFCGAG
jgi:threonine dehydratase